MTSHLASYFDITSFTSEAVKLTKRLLSGPTETAEKTAAGSCRNHEVQTTAVQTSPQKDYAVDQNVSETTVDTASSLPQGLERRLLQEQFQQKLNDCLIRTQNHPGTMDCTNGRAGVSPKYPNKEQEHHWPSIIDTMTTGISRKQDNSLPDAAPNGTPPYQQHRVASGSVIWGTRRPADWCRWPVCTVYFFGRECPLGEGACPDAHVGPDFADQINSNGLVRVCFENLGVGSKFCYRPHGCCRFFHPPEHIRRLLLKQRHLIVAPTVTHSPLTASHKTDTAQFRLKEPVGSDSGHSTAPGNFPVTATRTHTPGHIRDAAGDSIALFTGMLDYNQLIHVSAALLSALAIRSEGTTRHEDERSGTLTTQQRSAGELEPRYTPRPDPEVLALIATVVDKQLMAYSAITSSIRSQLTSMDEDKKQ